MKPLARYWREDYGVDRPLESDSLVRRLLNRYVVAALMNTFPGAATKVFSRSRGELARLLFAEREGGSYRVLRAMYAYEDRAHRGDLINRLLMQSPAVKAARNRRRIAQRMLQVSLESLPPHAPALVLALGGGDGSLEAEVIARNPRRDVFYCGVDMDERAADENREVLKRQGIEGRGVTFAGTIAEKADVDAVLDRAGRRFGVRFDGVGVAVCQGITEYLDLGLKTNETLSRLLTAIRQSAVPGGSLVISQTDYHDRVKYLERGLSWHMRLRSSDELAAEVEKAGWRIAECEMEPMRLITMCRAANAEPGRLRVDGESPLRQAAAKRAPAPTAGWRLWARGRR